MYEGEEMSSSEATPEAVSSLRHLAHSMPIYRTTPSCTVHITGYEAARMETAFGHGQPRTDRLAREP